MKEIAAYEDRLKRLFTKAGKIADPELQSHFARYLCILVSGYLEVSVRCVLREYIRPRAHPNALNYFDDSLKWFQNPKADLIQTLVGRFNPAWQETLRETMEGQLKDAVNSIVANRNLIAHGQDVGMSLGDMIRYYASAQKVVQELKNTCI